MNQKRQPAGVPVGGEFAHNEHDEAGVLTAVTPPMCERHGGEWGDDPTCETCTTEVGDETEEDEPYSLSTALRDSENGYVKALVARFDEEGIENSEERQDLARQWYRDLGNDEDEENAPGLGLSTEEREQAGDELRKFSEHLISSGQRLRYGVGSVVVSLGEDDDSDDAADTLNNIADQVEDGNTSGYYPTWELRG